jgi:hypothetical protein
MYPPHTHTTIASSSIATVQCILSISYLLVRAAVEVSDDSFYYYHHALYASKHSLDYMSCFADTDRAVS